MKHIVLLLSFFLFTFTTIYTYGQIVNGGSSQGQLLFVPGMNCNSCEYINKDFPGWWRTSISPVRVTPWGQNFVVNISYSIDKPIKIRGLNGQGGEKFYDLTEFESTLSQVYVDFEIVSEMTTPGNGAKEIYTSKFRASKFGNHTVKYDLLTFRPGALLDSLYRMDAQSDGDIDPTEFQSKFKFRIVSITAIKGFAYGYTSIDKELGRKLGEDRKKSQVESLLTEARDAEAVGNYVLAKEKYTLALSINNSSEIRAKISSLDKQIKDAESNGASRTDQKTKGYESENEATEKGARETTSQTEVTEKTTNENTSQAEINRQKREADQARAEAIAIGAVVVAGVLSEVLPETNFFLGTLASTNSFNGQKLYMQIGFGYKLTPDELPKQAALGANFIFGLYNYSTNWSLNFRDPNTNNSYRESFDKLKPSPVFGIGASFFFDSPAETGKLANKAFNISGTWSYGSIIFSKGSQLEGIDIPDSPNDRIEFKSIKVDMIHFFKKNNRITGKGISIGLGYETTKVVFTDYYGRDNHETKGLFAHIGYSWF